MKKWLVPVALFVLTTLVGHILEVQADQFYAHYIKPHPALYWLSFLSSGWSRLAVWTLLFFGAFYLWDRKHTKHMKGGGLSEYDPKIYLDPLNGEFVSTGIIPFAISNKGQRQNVAHRVQVQSPSIAPDVTFEYIDHIQHNDSHTLLPKIKGGILEHNNFLAVLQEAGEGCDRLPFEIAITYEDVTGTRKFQTTVSLEYRPSEHDAAIAELTKPNPATHEILKVMKTYIRRLP